MTSRPRGRDKLTSDLLSFNCFLVLDIFVKLCLCALLKYFIINYETQVKNSCICGGGPYVVEAPVHWHIVHMPKSGPHFRRSKVSTATIIGLSE